MDNKKFWCEFLELYRDLPALWRVKSSEYTNRVVKANEYEKLVEKLKELYPDANREMAVRKINNIRTSYRKEVKKVRDSQKIDSGTGEIYTPSLWYFDLLSFLEGQDDGAEVKTEEETSTPRPKRKITSEEDTPIKKTCRDFPVNRNANSDILVKSWSSQYKEMQESQKLLARKIISDILYHGYMETLKMGHTIEIQQILQSTSQSDIPNQLRGLQNYFQNFEDMLAESWNSQYKELQGNQKLLARKIISDILFYGCMDMLNMSHTIDIQQILLRDSVAVENLLVPLNEPPKFFHNFVDTLGKSWSSEYKEIQENQKFIVQKIFSDVLFHGCLGTLNMSNAVEIQQILLRDSLIIEESLTS